MQNTIELRTPEGRVYDVCLNTPERGRVQALVWEWQMTGPRGGMKQVARVVGEGTTDKEALADAKITLGVK